MDALSLTLTSPNSSWNPNALILENNELHLFCHRAIQILFTSWCVLPWHSLVRHIKEVQVPLVVLGLGWGSRSFLGVQFGQDCAGWPALFVRGGICDIWLLAKRSTGELGCSILVCWKERIHRKNTIKFFTQIKLQRSKYQHFLLLWFRVTRVSVSQQKSTVITEFAAFFYVAAVYFFTILCTAG